MLYVPIPRSAPVQAPARALRAASFAGSSALLAVAAHAAGGGGLPPLSGLLLGFAGIWLIWLILAGRERRLPGIVAGLLLAQAALHLWFVALGHHSGGSGHAAAGHTGSGGAAESVLGPSPAAMVAFHLSATVVAGLWLRRYEQRFWAVARRAVLTVRLALMRLAIAFEPPHPAPVPVRLEHRDAARLHRQVWGNAASRRGPPCG